jgi:hypothetical protein
MTLRQATPLSTTLAEPMLAEGCRELLGRDQQVKDALEGFDVEVGMLASVSIIALEARQAAAAGHTRVEICALNH